jgi:cell fate regulator YaaT (PSP1 superfamily)
MEISGVCGRLLCCLAYENDYYIEAKRRMPRVGQMVHKPHGEGKVVGVNVVKEAVNVQISSETTVTVKASEVETQPTEGGQGSRRRRRR